MKEGLCGNQHTSSAFFTEGGLWMIVDESHTVCVSYGMEVSRCVLGKLTLSSISVVSLYWM